MCIAMITSPDNSLAMKHIRKTANGRKFSIDVEAGMDNKFVSLASKRPMDERLKTLVTQSWQGMRSGYSPTLSEAGVGGTYFMKDSFNRRIGVFKPHDEEMGCQNNPKGFTPMSKDQDFIRRRVSGGDAAFRECAAYALDHEHFSGVPATDLVVCSYPCFNNSPNDTISSEENFKIGSFQEFKEHDFDAEDISPSKAARFPVSEVHKIALLDIRLFNTDRHGGNILVRKVYSPPHKCGDEDCSAPTTPVRHEYGSDADENGIMDNCMQFEMDFGYDDDEDESMYSLTSSSSSASSFHDDAVSYELIPIDHGYTLPRTVSGIADSWFEWLNWPQAKVPFSDETKEYISRLDAERDIALLRQQFGDWIEPQCYRVLRITTAWLKLGAQYDLTPYELGIRMCCQQVDASSELEQLVWEAEELVDKEAEDQQHIANGVLAEQLFFVRLLEVMDKKMKEIVSLRSALKSSRNLKFFD